MCRLIPIPAAKLNMISFSGVIHYSSNGNFYHRKLPFVSRERGCAFSLEALPSPRIYPLPLSLSWAAGRRAGGRSRSSSCLPFLSRPGLLWPGSMLFPLSFPAVFVGRCWRFAGTKLRGASGGHGPPPPQIFCNFFFIHG